MTEAEFIAGFAVLVLFAGAFGIPCEPDAIKPLYRAVLAEMPGDLFEKACRLIAGTWNDTYRMPTPAHIIESVKPEWDVRRGANRFTGPQNKLLPYGEFVREPMSPETERLLDETMSKLKSINRLTPPIR